MIAVIPWKDAQGEVFVTLSYIRVGDEHNTREQIDLDVAEATRLRDDLNEVLAQAKR